MRDSLLSALKLLLWDLKDQGGRRNFIEWVLRPIPGEYGIMLRRMALKRYFASAGNNLMILEGVHFRGMHELSVGDNVGIGVGSFVQASGGLSLGHNVLLGPGVKIWTVNHVYDDPIRPIREQGYQAKRVVIEDDVWVGAASFIMPGAYIGRGSVVAAGSVVGGKRIEDFSILAGNPARRIGGRVWRSGGLHSDLSASPS